MTCLQLCLSKLKSKSHSIWQRMPNCQQYMIDKTSKPYNPLRLTRLTSLSSPTRLTSFTNRSSLTRLSIPSKLPSLTITRFTWLTSLSSSSCLTSLTRLTNRTKLPNSFPGLRIVHILQAYKPSQADTFVQSFPALPLLMSLPSISYLQVLASSSLAQLFGSFITWRGCFLCYCRCVLLLVWVFILLVILKGTHIQLQKILILHCNSKLVIATSASHFTPHVCHITDLSQSLREIISA